MFPFLLLCTLCIPNGYLILACLQTECLCVKEVQCISGYYDHLSSYILLVSPVVIFLNILWKSTFAISCHTWPHLAWFFSTRPFVSFVYGRSLFFAFVVLVKAVLMNLASLNLFQSNLVHSTLSWLWKYYHRLFLCSTSKLDSYFILEILISLPIIFLSVSWDSWIKILPSSPLLQ